MKTTFELVAHLASARPKPNSRLRAREDTGAAQLGAAHARQRPMGKQTRAKESSGSHQMTTQSIPLFPPLTDSRT